MTVKPKAIVITGNGTNCEREAAQACRLGGFDASIVHIADLLAGEATLDDYHFLNLTGGFLDGDDLGSAKVQANRLLYARVRGSGERVADQLRRFVRRGRPILGVCNGFQLMVKMGLLPDMDATGVQSATLTFNDGGRFEDRWVRLAADPGSPCLFTKGMGALTLPVRHGEGKFFAPDDIMDRIEERRLAPLRYADPVTGAPTMAYPANPNGSLRSVAGVCSPDGLLFGLMPHPEAFLHRINHPRWTREVLSEEGAGIAFFRNAFEHVRQS